MNKSLKQFVMDDKKRMIYNNMEYEIIDYMK